MDKPGSLSNSELGTCPVVSIQSRLELAPGESAVIDYNRLMPEQESMKDYRKIQGQKSLTVFLTWLETQGQIALRQINVTEVDAQLYGRLASAILYANPFWRANTSILRAEYPGRIRSLGLWYFRGSSDCPCEIEKSGKH